MDKQKIKLVALDLDGTLTVHRTPLGDKNKQLLDQLRQRYRLVMVGAGASGRIFRQMGNYPIDVIGNYGMEVTRYDAETSTIVPVHQVRIKANQVSVTERVKTLRHCSGFLSFTGDTVEFQDSGMVCIPLLGTKAAINDKLAFDPDKEKRRAWLPFVQQLFPEYKVYIGGSSSFDMVPEPYGKYYALNQFCAEQGFSHEEVVCFGDDITPGGGDYDLYVSDFPFVTVIDSEDFPAKVAFLLS